MRVVYVAGWLRSGTTLLTQLLGSLPDTTALGELSGIWGAAAGGGRCSCGQPIGECPIWSRGLTAVEAAHGIGPAELSDFAALTRSVLRTRQAQRLASLGAKPAEAWPSNVRTYVGVIGTLLDAVAAAAGSRVLVDSSKLPPGFLTVGLVPGIRVDVIHIVRDPRAVANSELRSMKEARAGNDPAVPGRSLLKSTVYWSLGNLAVKRFGSAADSYTSLRYEELSASPADVIGRLAKRLVLAESGSVQPEPGLHSGHIAVGNPHRFDDPLRVIRTDEAWQTELSLRQRLVVSAVSGPARAVLR